VSARRPSALELPCNKRFGIGTPAASVALPYWAVFSADLRGPARPRQHQRATTRRGPCFSSVVPEVPHAKNPGHGMRGLCGATKRPDLAAKVVAGVRPRIQPPAQPWSRRQRSDRRSRAFGRHRARRAGAMICHAPKWLAWRAWLFSRRSPGCRTLALMPPLYCRRRATEPPSDSRPCGG
jgi:hypothetical protein